MDWSNPIAKSVEPRRLWYADSVWLLEGGFGERLVPYKIHPLALEKHYIEVLLPPSPEEFQAAWEKAPLVYG